MILQSPALFTLSALQGLVIIFVAPLLRGWMQQITAWLQQRHAPSIVQPYYALRKLLAKEPVISTNASWLFRFTPYIYCTILIVVSFNLPFYMTATLAYRSIDFIVFVGLLALGRVLLALAAMDVGTAFGSLGARREMFIACLSEPVLLIIFYNITLVTHSVYLSNITHYFLTHSSLYPGLAFSLLAFFLLLFAELGRIPIDNPATHLELTMVHEAMLLEYSGRYLALIEWGHAIKTILYFILLIAVFFPFGIPVHLQLGSLLLGGLSTLIKLSLLGALVCFIEAINSKLRIFKIPDYLAGALMLAVLGVLVTQLIGVSTV